jgi:hypothetical protein
MTVLPIPEIYGYTIFCDDIRQEVGGKISFVGVYSGTMFVHGEFPVTLPKFAFGISLMQRREILEPNIQVQIFLPGDPEDSPSIGGHPSLSREPWQLKPPARWRGFQRVTSGS